MTEVKISFPEDGDILWITQNSSITKPFHSINIKKLFETSIWSLVVKEANQPKACAAFQSYPNMHYDLKEWEHQIQEHKGRTTFEGLSTLFLGYFICEADNKREDYLKLILRKTFCFLPFILNCCFLTQIGEEVDEVLDENFQQKFDLTNDLRIWNCQRGSIVPEIGIRSKMSEDYLALKNLFSQIYSLTDSKMVNFTLDFLDYGEDRCPTYKYFSFDEDNTYIGIADKDGAEAVGFVCATTQHVDLEFLNENFQLEAVYGLRKRSPEDSPKISFGEDNSNSTLEQSPRGTSEVESSISLDDDVVHALTDILDEVESKSEIIECLRDIFDETFPKQETEFENKEVHELFGNENLNISNPEHLSFIKHNSLPTATIVRIVNSTTFDVKNDQHMELVTRLEEDVLKVEPERLKQILNSEAFDPSEEAYAKLSLRVMDKMPYHKLNQFRKSSIGAKIYENIKLKLALSKQKSEVKLSFADMQVLLRQKANSSKYKYIEPDKPSKSSAQELKLTNIHYRNMGFISGLTDVKGTYRIQDNYILSKDSQTEDETSDKHENHESTTDDNNKYPIPSLRSSSDIKIYVPKYQGDINCTFIEQLAIEEEYEHGSLSLIMAALKYFTRVEYAILLLPYGTKKVPLLRQYFTQVPARPFSRYDKELFVFHKSGFNQQFKVRHYENKDFEGVKTLVRCSCLKDYLLNDLDQCLKETDKHMGAIVLVLDDKIFGIAVISEILEYDFIRKNYDVGDRVNLKYHKLKTSGELLHCVLHPIAKLLSGDFVKEAMRLTGKSIIYHKIFPTRIVPYNPSSWQSLCNILDRLIPLRLTEISPPKLEIQLRQDDDKEENSTSTYSLCYTSTKMILRDLPTVSSRIVVIGCSDIAIGVLETLIYSSKYRFTNLTIISKTCIPGEFILNEKCHQLIPQKSDYTQSSLDSLCMPAWVTSVKGKVTLIEQDFLKIEDLKENKNDSYQVGFDFLVICENLEYQAEKVEKSVTPKEIFYQKKYSMLKNLWEHSFDTVKTPCNIFSLNTAEDGAKVLNWLWKYFCSKESLHETTSWKNEKDTNTNVDRIVVYGSSLNAYVCVAILLEENLPSTKITFVKESTKRNSLSYYSRDIEEAIDYVYQQSELEMYEGNLKYTVDDDQVNFVNVTTQEKSLQLDCCALILFDTKNINFEMAKVLHGSNLSFVLPTENANGYPYLFINSNFQTNKPNIFAAGTVTEMHARNYKSIRFENCFYNPKEIGFKIGDNIIKTVDEKLDRNAATLPILQRPSLTVAKLPFGFTYILIISPSPEFRTKCEPSIVKSSIFPALLVLGNLKVGSGIVPEIVPETEANEEKDLEDTHKNDRGQESEESLEKTEIEHSTKDTTGQVEVLPATIPSTRTFPAEPEYFAMEFNPSEHIQRIEVLTKKAIVVDTLIQLFDLQLEQIYKIFGIVTSEGSDKVSFCLSGDWILPLDYFTLRDRDHIENDFESNCGFEGFWRPGYPEYMMSRINTFLDNFSKHSNKN